MKIIISLNMNNQSFEIVMQSNYYDSKIIYYLVAHISLNSFLIIDRKLEKKKNFTFSPI